MTCWSRAPLMIELIPKTAKPNIPPEMKSSKIPWLGVKSIKKYALPIKKLSIPIPIIVYFVFGRVLIYFDNPATLLILDIKFVLLFLLIYSYII